MQKATNIAEGNPGHDNIEDTMGLTCFLITREAFKGRIISKEERGVAGRPQTLFIIRKKDG